MKHTKIQQIIRSHVPSLEENVPIQIQSLDGITNNTFAVIVNAKPQFIYKQLSAGCNRQREFKIVKLLAQKNLCPQRIFEGSSYTIQYFLKDTKHPTHLQINQKQFTKRVMQVMVKFHEIKFNQQTRALNQAQYIFSKQQQEQIEMINICINNEQNQFNENKDLNQGINVSQQNSYMKRLKQLLCQVQIVLSQKEKWSKKLLFSSSTGLCHNDLHKLNILFNQKEMHFIDYDYIGNNYIPYDIANFINQSKIQYINISPGFKISEKVSIQEIKLITSLYPLCYNGLDIEVLAFLSVCNLYWAIWSLKYAMDRKGQIFDMVYHGQMRMQLFWHYSNMLSSYLQKLQNL